MTTDEAFASLREGVQKDIKDGFDQDSANMALAIISVAEELLSKLERIAVTAERHLELAEHGA